MVVPFLVLAEYPSVVAAVATSLSGAAVVGLGYAVYRGKGWAAWTLVVFAVVDIVARNVHERGGFLMPLILIFAALSAASSLSKGQDTQHGTDN